jgi:hypothetical protein
MPSQPRSGASGHHGSWHGSFYGRSGTRSGSFVRLVAWYLAVVLLVTVGLVAIDKLVVPLPTTAFALAWLFILNPLLMLPFVLRFFKARRKLRAP